MIRTIALFAALVTAAFAGPGGRAGYPHRTTTSTALLPIDVGDKLTDGPGLGGGYLVLRGGPGNDGGYGPT